MYILSRLHSIIKEQKNKIFINLVHSGFIDEDERKDTFLIYSLN
jgi:hypothetical protein